MLVAPARPAFLAVLCLGILIVFSALPPAPKPFRFVLPKRAMPFSVQNLIRVPAARA